MPKHVVMRAQRQHPLVIMATLSKNVPRIPATGDASACVMIAKKLMAPISLGEAFKSAET